LKKNRKITGLRPRLAGANASANRDGKAARQNLQVLNARIMQFS